MHSSTSTSLCAVETSAPRPATALVLFPKYRQAERRSDEEIVRIHVGRRLAGLVTESILREAQEHAAERVELTQMQVAINEAIAFALEQNGERVAA